MRAPNVAGRDQAPDPEPPQTGTVSSNERGSGPNGPILALLSNRTLPLVRARPHHSRHTEREEGAAEQRQ